MEELRTFPTKFTKELLEKISNKNKITTKQANRLLDIVYLMAIDQDDDMQLTAYKGYLRRKLEDGAMKQLFKKVNKKFIEFFGEIEEIDYSQFNPAPQDSKNFFLIIF